jgi:ribosomal protein L11 methyltransferase
MTWTRVRFTLPSAQQEIAMALLADLPFSAFQESEEFLDAYAPTADCNPALRASLQPGPGVLWTAVEWEELPDENWNSRWESHFDPVILAPFCAIRAIFHQPVPGVTHEIVIQPEMAFGTGHHATTRMMLAGMQDLDFRGKRVLDFGAGTAVLAILAARLGASQVDAVEIEGPACESARENVIRNGVAGQVQVIHGDGHAIPGPTYDLVLANINRNVLVAESRTLDQWMAPGGIAVLSGFLVSDREVLAGAVTALGWTILREDRELDWLAQRWQKPNS